METIQERENRSGLEPIQDFEYVANLQAKEELQRVTTLLDQTREEETHQQDLMIAPRQDAKQLTHEM
eukprot:10875351-Prorocentrum_lima.AAC.1